MLPKQYTVIVEIFAVRKPHTGVAEVSVIGVSLKLKPGCLHMYEVRLYEYLRVCNGTQELHVRRGLQAEGYRCCGGRKKAGRCSPVQDRRKASKTVVFGSQYQLLADVGC